MLGQFGEEYRKYMDRTGMFLPDPIEAAVCRLVPVRRDSVRAVVVIVALAVLILGGAFAARTYTVRALPLWSNGPVTALAVLPGDRGILGHRMATVLDLPEIKARLQGQPGPVLVYVMPRDYVMQGMIADTGDEWQLYKRHHTFTMIWDWIFHPFGHLESSHFAIHHPGMGGSGDATGLIRRLIFLRIETPGVKASPTGVFAIDARRTPIFSADVEMHGLGVLGVQDLRAETGWGRIPTPAF